MHKHVWQYKEMYMNNIRFFFLQLLFFFHVQDKKNTRSTKPQKMLSEIEMLNFTKLNFIYIYILKKNINQTTPKGTDQQAN
jgi:hypothetical protein